MGPASGIGLVYGVATHALSPMMAVTMAMTSPRLMGELLTSIAKIPKVSPSVGQAVRIGVAIRPDLAASQAAKQQELQPGVPFP